MTATTTTVTTTVTFQGKSQSYNLLHIKTTKDKFLTHTTLCKDDHRLFNISIANKLSKGFIRNNHDVINFSYRNYLTKNFVTKNNTFINEKIINVAQNYRPNLVVLGHNNILESIDELTTNDINIGESDRQRLKIALMEEKRLRKSNEGRSKNKNDIDQNFQKLVGEKK